MPPMCSARSPTSLVSAYVILTHPWLFLRVLLQLPMHGFWFLTWVQPGSPVSHSDQRTEHSRRGPLAPRCFPLNTCTLHHCSMRYCIHAHQHVCLVLCGIVAFGRVCLPGDCSPNRPIAISCVAKQQQHAVCSLQSTQHPHSSSLHNQPQRAGLVSWDPPCSCETDSPGAGQQSWQVLAGHLALGLPSQQPGPAHGCPSDQQFSHCAWTSQQSPFLKPLTLPSALFSCLFSLTTGFVPYAGEGFALLLPSKWNPSKEQDFPGTILR